MIRLPQLMPRHPLCAQCRSRHPYGEHDPGWWSVNGGPKHYVPFRNNIEAFSPVPQPIPERRWWRK